MSAVAVTTQDNARVAVTVVAEMKLLPVESDGMATSLTPMGPDGPGGPSGPSGPAGP